MNYVVYLIIVGRDASGADVIFPMATVGHRSALNHDADGRIQDPGVLIEHCFGPGRLRGDMEVTSTNLVLLNEDGALDGLYDYAFDYSTVIFALHPETFAGVPVASGNYGRQATVRVEQPVFDEKVVNFALRHYRAIMQYPWTTVKYAGTNSGAPLAGIEGTASDLKGQPKPAVLGQVFNVTPKLVNTTKLIYQADGRRGFITGYSLTVYDKRVALVAGADYVSQADMEATAPAVGQYRVWPAGGCFRLGSAPVGAITCDVTNPPLPAGGASDVLNAINAINYHYQPATLGIQNIGSHNLSANPTVGIYVEREYTHLQLCNEVLASVGAFLFFTATEAPVLTQITAPGSPLYLPALNSIELDDSAIIPGTLQQVIQGDGGTGLPVWRVNLNYARNYTVMSASELAGAAAADIAFCEREYRTVQANDASVKTQWPHALELNVNTLLTDQTQAQAEADRLLALFKVRRQCFRLRVHGWVIRAHPQFDGVSYRASDFQVTCRVRITLDRYGWGAGKTMLVIGIERHLDIDQYELTVWG